MVNLAGWIWEGLSTETKPMDAQGSKDGHVFKELDTGESYVRRAGTWQFINLGLSFIKATKSGQVTTNSHGTYHVTFNTPFIDDQYTVALTCMDSGITAVGFGGQITANGFDMVIRDKNGHPVGNITVSWLATRNYNP